MNRAPACKIYNFKSHSAVWQDDNYSATQKYESCTWCEYPNRFLGYRAHVRFVPHV